jgi:hypothetical protein
MYKITKQYGKSKEMTDKSFSTLKEAKDYVQSSAESDASMKIAVIYRLYEFDEVIHELDTTKIVLSNLQSSSESSAGAKSSSASFRPTPLATSPSPKGSPPKWLTDPEADKNKDS